MRVLVCGGRDYLDSDTVNRVLNEIAAADHENMLGHIRCIIHGGQRGADSLAEQWAAVNWVPTERYPADWTMHGKAAGPIRNRQMLKQGHPDLVVAFPGEGGTADMVAAAKAAGIPVREIEPQPSRESSR